MTWREHLAAVIGAVLVLSVIAVVVARPIAVNLGGAEFTRRPFALAPPLAGLFVFPSAASLDASYECP
jgi:hypothetical protein